MPDTQRSTEVDTENSTSEISRQISVVVAKNLIEYGTPLTSAALVLLLNVVGHQCVDIGIAVARRVMRGTRL